MFVRIDNKKETFAKDNNIVGSLKGFKLNCLNHYLRTTYISVCQKYVEKHNGPAKMPITVLQICITCEHQWDQNLYELSFMEYVLFQFQV